MERDYEVTVICLGIIDPCAGGARLCGECHLEGVYRQTTGNEG